MADDEEEWLDYSSCLDRQESSVDSNKEEERAEIHDEDTQGEISDAERLENVRKVLKCSLRHKTVKTPSLCRNEIPSVSEIKGPFEHPVWLNLLAKLNSIRQTKWADSCLENHYNQCLCVSRNMNAPESSPVTVDSFSQNWFNFHGMKTYSRLCNVHELVDEKSGNLKKDVLIDSDNELVIENGMKCRDKFDSTGVEPRDNVSPKCGDTFEDLGPELEWSDNDVKDEAVTSNLSSVNSGFDESEAAADLSRLSYEEIIQLRKELRAYTKQYSDVLVIELEYRDAYIREKELRNNFISSFLAVQAKMREPITTNTKKKFSLQSNSVSTSQSLTIIPYEIQNGGPGPEILVKLIEIMEAMKTNSPNVPTLLTDYILKVLCK